MSIRPHQFHRREPQSQGDGTTLAKSFRRRKLDSTDMEFVSMFLQKRFAVLQDPEEWQFDDVSLEALAHSVGYADTAGFLAAHERLFDWFAEQTQAREILIAFTEWHNGSLRGVATSIFNLVHTLVCDNDPLCTYRELVGVDWTPNLLGLDTAKIDSGRFFHSLILRHLVFMNRRPPAEPPVTLYNNELAASPRPLFHLKVKMLEYLRKRQNETTRIGDLYRAFAAFEVPRAAVFSALVSVTAPRTYESSGLVLIDAKRKELTPDLDERREVQIQRAGVYALNKLGVSCEFLFWSAMYQAGGGRYLPKRLAASRITVEHAADETIRAEVAVSFFEEVILRPFLKEVRVDGVGRDVREHLALYDTSFANEDAVPMERFLAGVAQRSLHNFINDESARVSPGIKADLNRRLNDASTQLLDAFGTVQERGS